MKYLFNVTRWPGLLVFATAGAMTVSFAFITVNLFSTAMANLSFIQRHGWMAVAQGALWQLAGLIFWGFLALLSYVIFKICETELVIRYRHWADRH